MEIMKCLPVFLIFNFEVGTNAFYISRMDKIE